MWVDYNLISASCACSSLRLELVLSISSYFISSRISNLPKYSQNAGRLSRVLKIFLVIRNAPPLSVPFASHLILKSISVSQRRTSTVSKIFDRAAMRMLCRSSHLLKNYSSGCSEQFFPTMLLTQRLSCDCLAPSLPESRDYLVQMSSEILLRSISLQEIFSRKISPMNSRSASPAGVPQRHYLSLSCFFFLFSFCKSLFYYHCF